MEEQQPQTKPVPETKVYAEPRIILEIELETRAGSPLSLPDLDEIAE
jgi:hypothetical protein